MAAARGEAGGDPSWRRGCARGPAPAQRLLRPARGGLRRPRAVAGERRGGCRRRWGAACSEGWRFPLSPRSRVTQRPRAAARRRRGQGQRPRGAGPGLASSPPVQVPCAVGAQLGPACPLPPCATPSASCLRLPASLAYRLTGSAAVTCISRGDPRGRCPAGAGGEAQNCPQPFPRGGR